MSVKLRNVEIAKELAEFSMLGFDRKYVSSNTSLKEGLVTYTLEETKTHLDIRIALETGLLVGLTAPISVDGVVNLNGINIDKTVVANGINHYYVDVPDTKALQDVLFNKYKYYLHRLTFEEFRNKENYTGIEDLVDILFEVESQIKDMTKGQVSDLYPF